MIFTGFFHVEAFALDGIRTPVKCLEYVQRRTATKAAEL